MKRKTKFALLAIILLAAIIFSLYSYTQQGLLYTIITSDLDSLLTFIDSYGPLAALILVLLVVLEVVLAPIPPLLLYVAAGVLFGTLLGGALVLIGNLLGALIAFYLARTLAKDYLTRKIDKKTKKRFDNLSEKYGAFAIFFLRINPFTSSDLFSYLAGLTNMKLSHFLIATALGLTPLIFLQTYLGADIISTNPILFTIFIIISVVYLIAFFFLIIKTLLRKNKS